MFRAVLGLCCALTLAAVPLAAQAQAMPPVAAYGRLPAIETAVMSPDGARLAYIGGSAADRVIFITPIDGGAPVTIRPGAVNVTGLRWAGSRHLLVGISMFENSDDYASGLMTAYSYNRDLIVDAATGEAAGQVLGQRSWNALALDMPVLAVVEGEKPYIVVQGLDLAPDAIGAGAASQSLIKKKGDLIVPALWRVDLANGKGRMLDRANRTTRRYLTDVTGEPRVRWDYDDVRNVETLMVRPKGGAVWRQVDSWKVEEQTAEYIGYSDPDDALIVRRVDKGLSRLVKLPLNGGPEVELVPLSVAHADVEWDEDRMAPVAVVTGDERPSYQWLDPQLAAIHARLSKALGGKQVTLASWSRDRSRAIVMAEAPDSPPVWYLYDVKTRQASLIGESYPELAGAAFGKTQWFTYAARDGLKIPAYLTLPPARADGRKPPLIVLPHGGPASRDEYGFDWIVQFLASRGYAVLQPQFRGSSGFGDDFALAGYGEWGGKMQTDLVDGVAAAAGHGVDTGRTCIVGLSYGGYAALAGAAFQPEVFRCAVSVSGVSDLPLWVGATRRAYGEESGALAYWRTAIGDPRTSGATMTAASPARRLGARASPILLMHAELDTTVPLEQSRVMERALRNVGQTAPLVMLEGDDHYLSKSASRVKFLSETEAFLGKHLPVAP
jgi:dipeptidyl aminopeptidase/acylaminoacyl peptidase